MLAVLGDKDKPNLSPKIHQLSVLQQTIVSPSKNHFFLP